MRGALALLCGLALWTGPAAGSVPVEAHAQPGHADASSLPSPAQPQTDGTMFKRINSENAGMVIQLNMSMLTSFFDPGSTFRLVVGGTANGERVVWFDIGIGYRGGPVFPNPMDGFVVQSEMTMNLPL